MGASPTCSSPTSLPAVRAICSPAPVSRCSPGSHRRGSTQRLAPRLDRATTRHTWTPDGRALYVLIEDRGRIGLYRLRLGDALPTAIAPSGMLGGFALARDGTRIAFDRATLSHPPALFAMPPDGRDERAIETLHRALP